VHVVVKGRVQGVGFRNWTYSQARLFRVTGWVKNLPSGEVEVVASGSKEALTEFLHELKNGPRLANVQDLQVSWGSGDPAEFAEFVICKG